ncbi:hypothetical protein C8R43DRAFT_823130, partial [Mycena crocata]
EMIRCRCGVSADDGFSIACDACGRWCHAACFGIKEGSVPEEWACWVCAPHAHPAMSTSNHVREGNGNGRRRRASVSAAHASTSNNHASSSSNPAHRRASTVEPALATEDEEALLADERAQYVLIDDDIVPDGSTQRKLRAFAARWRGVSALGGESKDESQHVPFVFGAHPPPAHPTLLHPLAPALTPQGPGYSSVRPPSYALHTALPAPPRTLLARLPTLITPSAKYLSEAANGYAHSGAPRRHVHIVGPPLDVALDGRLVGGYKQGGGRWARRGCWPNAEVRAYVCGGDEEDARDEGEPRTRFGIFATRALKQGEEIVVGWEWDDGNAVHRI